MTRRRMGYSRQHLELLEEIRRAIARERLAAKRAAAPKDPPASESSFWRPKGARPHGDEQWLKDGGWSGKR